MLKLFRENKNEICNVYNQGRQNRCDGIKTGFKDNSSRGWGCWGLIELLHVARQMPVSYITDVLIEKINTVSCT